jgi:hypothetical protein
MRSLATEICYPTINFNGDLVQFLGINCSGNNLTVFINGICNSLFHRCAYFSVRPKAKIEDFDKNVALITYGDDSKGTSKDKQFHHLALAEFAKSMDMEYTMPDKESKPVPFVPFDSVDFLKRKSVYHPQLGYKVGALDEDSIFKSLHVGLDSELSSLEQCSTNIDGALREWYFHGPELYEKRREQMGLVAEKHKITGWCRVLGMTYDDQVLTWRKNYL